jgi:hypothetical protein
LGDTLFIHSDTLKVITPDTLTNSKLLKAYNHVKLFGTEIQGKCDSMAYNSVDSSMRMYGEPVLWTGKNQISSDSIHIISSNNELKEMRIYSSALISSYEDTSKYNQIKGRNMYAYFKNNLLYKVAVKGNGQSIYYVHQGKKLIGVNKAESTDIDIYIKNNNIKKIVMLTKPNATLYPLSQAPLEELKLKGFKWLEQYRPLKRNDVFIWERK